MNTQEMKRYIQKWIRENCRLVSRLGDIVLGRQIGEGGTSLVFESEFAGGTAVKFLAESISSRSTRYQRFLSEYVNLIKLVPMGIVVPIYHFDVQDFGDGLQVPYILMERCVETLHERYRESKLRNEIEFRELLSRLLVILESVHKAGIVHRDIKPKNILLRPNGEWVLADFGIAWFDPEYYDKLAKTGKGDRLANFEFSPPEQCRRDAYHRAVPNMDLYALGQTLYYCVTGETIRGTAHTHLGAIAPALNHFDHLIEKLVRQKPSERFQSVSEVREALRGQEKAGREFEHTLNLVKEMLEQVKEFDRRIRRSMPGSYSYSQARDRNVINRVLASLAEDCEAYELNMFKGGRFHGNACPIRRLSDDIWLIWLWECEVTDLWVHRNSTSERQYVVLHLSPRPPFGFFDSEGRDRDVAGYFNGEYMDPNMLDDGYAEIDGEVIELTNAEERWRNLKDDFLILAPHLSVFNYSPNDDQVEEVYRSLLEAGRINHELLEPLEWLSRAPWMSAID